MAVINALDYNNEVFRGFITWSGLLIVKLLLMAFLTSFQRLRKGVSAYTLDIVLTRLLTNYRFSRPSRTQKMLQVMKIAQLRKTKT